MSFIGWNGEWDRKYRVHLDARWPTMKVALNLLYQMPEHRILETGCLRMADDWGGGMSTMLFAEFVSQMGGHVVSVDNTPRHVEICRSVLGPLNNYVDYIVGDSIVELRRMVEQNFAEPNTYQYDLIYLDSLDCPITGDASEAQQHQWRELNLAFNLAHDRTVILLDDNGFENGGKCKMSNAHLLSNGWTCLMQHQQSLWIRL